MYGVWKSGEAVPTVKELERVKAYITTIKPFEPEADGYVFLHGVAIAKFKGRLYCSWAHNKVRENSADEEVNYAVSDDNGRTWSECIKGNLLPDFDGAVSHGVFLVYDERLYFFAPRYKGHMGKEMMQTCAFVFDEQSECFAFAGVVLDDRFWPMCEPVLMEDGNYIMPGIYVGSGYRAPDNAAAVAISNGGDVLHWRMVKVPFSDNIKVWGECTIVVDGSNVKMYCREHSGKRIALFSESFDFGNTWTVMDATDLPMIDSKPYAGTLSDGRRYLICSCASDIKLRDPLTVAIARKGEDTFSKIYTIDSGKTLSYPYAIEIDKRLYVAYSSTTEGHNRNSAMLAVIDIEDLKP